MYVSKLKILRGGKVARYLEAGGGVWSHNQMGRTLMSLNTVIDATATKPIQA